jgi:hypothetical protein
MPKPVADGACVRRYARSGKVLRESDDLRRQGLNWPQEGAVGPFADECCHSNPEEKNGQLHST